MGSHVCLHVRNEIKPLVAHLTVVAFLSLVCSHVSLFVGHEVEPLVADFALETFFSGMRFLVDLQSRQMGEVLSADIAGERFSIIGFSCGLHFTAVRVFDVVDDQVTLKILGLDKGLPTKTAHA